MPCRGCDPDGAYVTGGLPTEVVPEVERFAVRLVGPADMSVDIADLGSRPRAEGLRRMDTDRDRLRFPASSDDLLLVVVGGVPPFDHL